jgi:hypothetical protein
MGVRLQIVMGQPIPHDKGQVSVIHDVGSGVYRRINFAGVVGRSQDTDAGCVHEVFFQIHISLLNICQINIFCDKAILKSNTEIERFKSKKGSLK